MDGDGTSGAAGPATTVTLPASVLDRYERFTLYNSPYPAHDRGCAIDLYPGGDRGISPVAGTVVECRTVGCPARPYAVDEDYLIVVDTGDRIARLLHVAPAVAPGDEVAVGDDLGPLVRSGYFGRWVDNHVHLGFREPGQDPHRATGSLPLSVDVPVRGVAWDGTGTVVDTGPTYALLDGPGHPDPGEGWVAVAADDGTPLDGGLVHYPGGGTLAQCDGPVSLLGEPVGTATGGDVDWDDVAVRADGVRATGLSLFASRVEFGAKLVFQEGHEFGVGDEVAVSIEPTSEPIVLA